MTRDLVKLLVLVNKLRSFLASYHHAQLLTTSSCLFGPIVSKGQSCLCLHKKGVGQSSQLSYCSLLEFLFIPPDGPRANSGPSEAPGYGLYGSPTHNRSLQASLAALWPLLYNAVFNYGLLSFLINSSPQSKPGS